MTSAGYTQCLPHQGHAFETTYPGAVCACGDFEMIALVGPLTYYGAPPVICLPRREPLP